MRICLLFPASMLTTFSPSLMSPTCSCWVRFSWKINFNFTAKQKTTDKPSIADCRTDIIMKAQSPKGSSTFHIQYEQWLQNNQAAYDASIGDGRRDVIIKAQNQDSNTECSTNILHIWLLTVLGKPKRSWWWWVRSPPIPPENYASGDVRKPSFLYCKH